MATFDWPLGPCSLEQLFRWPSRNAKALLLDDKDCQIHKNNFMALASRGISIHESYAGTGAAGTTLKIQYEVMRELCDLNRCLSGGTDPCDCALVLG